MANASRQSGQPNENIMFDNSSKILLRTARKRFLVFGLNVLGLSIGLSCVIFITIYSIDELSFMAESFLGVAPTLKREFAEVEDAVRIFPYKGTITVQYKSSDDKIFEAENTYQVDKEFFRIFKHSFIYGDEASLSKPNSIVITKSLAKKLFGENSPLNKVVLVDNQTFEVTGVINDLPRNSDLYYEALLSHDFSPDDDDWGNPFGFTNLLHMKFLTGETFSDLSNKSNKQAIVNQAFVKMAGYKNPESIIGEIVHAFDDKMKIVGVVTDFNYQDSRQEIRPLIMIPTNQTTLDAKKILIQLNGLDGLKSVQDAYQNLASKKPFEYTFLDERVKKMFEQEETTGQITEMFSLLAIILAGIGLYSLSSLILVQRTKEIGVRKIHGITQGALVALLSKEFLILSLIAFLISIPFAWTQSQSWLSDYAFKTDISIMTLGLTGLIILTILIFGILTNILKSAKMNPVDLIKSE